MTDKPMSMVERGTQAILARVPQGYGMTKAEAEDYTRAVISAMREPTEGMIAAADKIIEADNLFQRGYGYGGGAQQLHRAMIDAALTESK